MIRLDTIDLDDYLQIPDWFTSLGSAGSDRMTLGGVWVSQRLTGSRAGVLTLTAKYEGNKLFGRFFQPQIEAIVALRDAGSAVQLIYNSYTATVIIAQDGIDVTPVGNRTDPSATHPYYGTIQLLRSL